MTAPVNPWSTPPQNSSNESQAPTPPQAPAAPQAPSAPTPPAPPTPPANPLKNDQVQNPLAPPAALESNDDSEQAVLAVPADSAEQVDPNPTQADDKDTDKAEDKDAAKDKSDDKDTDKADDKDSDKAEEKPAPKKRGTRRKPKSGAKSNAKSKSDGNDPLVAVTELVDNLTEAIERDFTELQSLAPADALDKVAEIADELDTLNKRAGTAAEKLNELVGTIDNYSERGTTLRGAYEAVVNAFK